MIMVVVMVMMVVVVVVVRGGDGGSGDNHVKPVKTRQAPSNDPSNQNPPPHQPLC